MPDVPLTAGPLSAAGPFPLLCSGLSLLPEPVLAAASVPPVLPLRVARSIRPAPVIRRSRTNLRPCGETLPPPRLPKKWGGRNHGPAAFALSGAAPDGDIRSLCAASGPGSLRGAWNRTVRGGPAAVPEAGLLSGAGRRMGCAVPTGLSPPEARPLPGYSSSVSV